MPDNQGRPTLAELIAEIEDDIERADLGAQVAKAVERAIRHYQPVRFFFNERSLTFQTTPGTDLYVRGDRDEIPNLLAIDSAVLIESEQTAVLRRMPETEIERLDDPAGPSRPCAFSYFDRGIRLWPVPSGEWTIRLTAHVLLPAPKHASKAKLKDLLDHAEKRLDAARECLPRDLSRRLRDL
jgi:hypothetical protein